MFSSKILPRLWLLGLMAATAGCAGTSGSDDSESVTCEGPDGTIYTVGESYDSDCNTCTCQDDGTISCTDLGCP